MQEKNRASRDFLERTDLISARLNVSLRELAPRMGISQAALFGYRSGKIPLSRKAWAKLEAAERAAGIGDEPVQALPGVTNRDQPDAYREEPPMVASPAETAEMIERIARIEAALGSLTRLVKAIADALNVSWQNRR